MVEVRQLIGGTGVDAATHLLARLVHSAPGMDQTASAAANRHSTIHAANVADSDGSSGLLVG